MESCWSADFHKLQSKGDISDRPPGGTKMSKDMGTLRNQSASETNLVNEMTPHQIEGECQHS